MAVLDKKLKVIKNGVTEEITLYSTTQEVAPDYISAGGGYAKLGSTSDPNASRIRVHKKNNTYAVLKPTKVGKILFNKKIAPNFSEDITDYFTTPSGCHKVLVKTDFENENISRYYNVNENTKYTITAFNEYGINIRIMISWALNGETIANIETVHGLKSTYLVIYTA